MPFSIIVYTNIHTRTHAPKGLKVTPQKALDSVPSSKKKKFISDRKDFFKRVLP